MEILPIKYQSQINYLESLNNFTEDFMEHREQLMPQTRESFDE